MRVHSNFFPAILARQFIVIFIGLLGVFLSGGLVFAQDSDHSIGSKKINPEYLATSSKSLNVRQQPAVLSPCIPLP